MKGALKQKEAEETLILLAPIALDECEEEELFKKIFSR